MPPLPHSNIQKVNQAQLRYPNPLMKCKYWLQRRNRFLKASLMPSRKGVRRVDLRFWSYEILISSGQQSRSKAFCCAALSAHTESLRDETHPSREERFYSECVWRPVRFRKQHASTTGLFKDTQSVHDPTDNESPDRSGLPLGHEGSSLGLNEITIVEARYPSGSCQLLCAKLVHKLMSNRIMSV